MPFSLHSSLGRLLRPRLELFYRESSFPLIALAALWCCVYARSLTSVQLSTNEWTTVQLLGSALGARGGILLSPALGSVNA